ncbi:hypothetical protein AVEN_1334-1 [Araneus ventricosus]|uniref:Uncharacterized protein n=1 Tax=Araneus ventricosus TaxID=182803 RepID=A0A4Y2D3W3_ARAVE|nr:hypothetical protein AVEN_1334-1 [Araneus ventricosus]
MWAKKNPCRHQPVPLHSEKVIVWCGFKASLIVEPFFVGEIGPAGPVTCTFTGVHYESLFAQPYQSSTPTACICRLRIFLQGGTPPHVANPVKRVLSLHFRNDRIPSCHFPTNCPPRSPDLNPCDFWLWGFLNILFSVVRLQT